MTEASEVPSTPLTCSLSTVLIFFCFISHHSIALVNNLSILTNNYPLKIFHFLHRKTLEKNSFFIKIIKNRLKSIQRKQASGDLSQHTEKQAVGFTSMRYVNAKGVAFIYVIIFF